MPRKAPESNGHVAGLVPVSDKEAELAVLGAVLLPEGGRAALEKIADYIRPQHFYWDRHMVIYTAMLGLLRDGEPVDIVTVADKLRQMGKLENPAGNTSGLAMIQEGAISALNVEAYAQIVFEKWAAREFARAGGDLIGKVQQGADPAELHAFAMERIYKIVEQDERNDLERMQGAVEEVWEEYVRAREGGGPPGLLTGFPDLDRLTGGFRESELTLVGALTSTGKTAFALNIACNIALRGVPVAMFSIEMTRRELVWRMASMLSEVDAKRLERGEVSPGEEERFKEALNAVSQAPIYVDESPSLNPMAALAKARRAHMKRKYGLIIVDHLHLMDPMPFEDKGSGDVKILDGIVRGLRVMARELEVPVMALCQLNQEAESTGPKGEPPPPPGLRNLRGSGGLGHTANVVLTLHRPERFKADAKPGICQVFVAKNRNGPQGNIVELLFRKDFQLFLPASYANSNHPDD